MLGECCMGMLDRPTQLVPIQEFCIISPFIFKGTGNASETQEETSLPALMFFNNPRSLNDFTVPQVTASQWYWLILTVLSMQVEWGCRQPSLWSIFFMEEHNWALGDDKRSGIGLMDVVAPQDGNSSLI